MIRGTGSPGGTIEDVAHLHELSYHCVFSTKERRTLLTSEIRERLWPFIGGIARANGFQSIEVGGHIDHAHTLISLPAKWSLSKAVQLMKGGSSKFINETFASPREFEWQEGFGGFTVRRSDIDHTVSYIRGQEEHHRVRSFEEEYLALLQEHHIEYNARYVFG